MFAKSVLFIGLLAVVACNQATIEQKQGVVVPSEAKVEYNQEVRMKAALKALVGSKLILRKEHPDYRKLLAQSQITTMGASNFVVLNHTVSGHSIAESGLIPADKSGIVVEKIIAAHEARGFSDVGYHFSVDQHGNIYTLRPMSYMGAHTRGFNLNSVGIGIVGMYSKAAQEDDPSLNLTKVTPELKQAMIYVLAAWGFAAEKTVSFETIKLRSELTPKSFPFSPGDQISDVLEEIIHKAEKLRKRLKLAA